MTNKKYKRAYGFFAKSSKTINNRRKERHVIAKINAKKKK